LSLGDGSSPSMDGGGRGAWPSQGRTTLDQGREIGGQAAVVRVAAPGTGKADQPVMVIPRKPTLGGSQRHVGLRGGTDQGQIILQRRLEHGEARHGQPALVIGEVRERGHDGVVRHGASLTSDACLPGLSGTGRFWTRRPALFKT
jgi:hypothetical protein